jgi:hypothetical protein
MRLRALGALLVAAGLVVVCTGASACGSGGIFRQYEYDEDMYLSLDGSATLYVHSSLAALNALRGTSFDACPTGRIDRDAVRRYFETAVTHVTQNPSTSRRNGRRFVHVRIDVPDIRRLHEAPPFAWSTYEFARDRSLYSYVQTVAGVARTATAGAGWNGRELVAFRLHLPSKITYHNTVSAPRRGNILVWEQSLTDRLRGVPLRLEARMEMQSILYRTLWLFATTFAAVVVTFGLVIWWILRRGALAGEREKASQPVARP